MHFTGQCFKESASFSEPTFYYHGIDKHLSDLSISVKKQAKRRPWSNKEREAVQRHLGKQLLFGDLPGKKEIEACLLSEQVLCSRTWTNVKDFCRNEIKKRGKKN